jgi:hypothetical protein
MLKRVVRRLVRNLREWMREEDTIGSPPATAIMYWWTNAMFLKMRRQGLNHRYAWGALQGVHLAVALGMTRVSLIEFGVAWGNGLVALDQIALKLEHAYGIAIDVYGFDTGRGLPSPTDYRDLPNLYAEQEFAMPDHQALAKRLSRAKLILGPVEETLPRFIKERPAPVAFVSIDLDYYSSTVAALRLFEADYDLLLPRIYTYVDDILGWTCSDYTGERLAISEFNERHSDRKICPIPGLKHFVPDSQREGLWIDSLFLSHLFGHPLQARYDGLKKLAWTKRAQGLGLDESGLMRSIYDRL